MPVDPFTRYLRTMASERHSLLCDFLPQELHNIATELAGLESQGVRVTKLHPTFERETSSILDLQERANRFLMSFEQIWHGGKGPERNADVLVRSLFTYSADLREALDAIKEANVTVVPLLSGLETLAARLSLLALALVEIRDAYEAGRQAGPVEAKLDPARRR